MQLHNYKSNKIKNSVFRLTLPKPIIGIDLTV